MAHHQKVGFGNEAGFENEVWFGNESAYDKNHELEKKMKSRPEIHKVDDWWLEDDSRRLG